MKRPAQKKAICNNGRIHNQGEEKRFMGWVSSFANDISMAFSFVLFE
jgi:hypothetical protein